MNATHETRKKIELARIFWYTTDKPSEQEKMWTACATAFDVPEYATDERTEIVRVIERNENGKIIKFRPVFAQWRDAREPGQGMRAR